MRIALRSLPLALAMILAAPTLVAQGTGLDAALKFRTGLAIGDNDDHLTQRTLGIGVETGYKMGDLGRVSLELGWFYKPGDQYLVDLSKTQVVAGRNPINLANSVDSRKTDIQGFVVRLAYGKSFGDLGLHGGLQVGKLKFRQEFVGNTRDNTPTSSALTYADSYWGERYASPMSVSPYVGVTYKLNSFSEVELNVLALRYKAVDYVHIAGQNPKVSGGPAVGINNPLDTTVENSRMKPHVEFGYTIRF